MSPGSACVSGRGCCMSWYFARAVLSHPETVFLPTVRLSELRLARVEAQRTSCEPLKVVLQFLKLVSARAGRCRVRCDGLALDRLVLGSLARLAPPDIRSVRDRCWSTGGRCWGQDVDLFRLEGHLPGQRLVARLMEPRVSTSQGMDRVAACSPCPSRVSRLGRSCRGAS